MTLLLHVRTYNGQELWLIILGVRRYKALIFANVGTNNLNQFNAGNMDNVLKYANGKQAEAVHNYKHIKENLYSTNAAIWYNKSYKIKQLTPKCINIRIKEQTNKHSIKTKNLANKYGLNQI
jgi:hypothetical protein